MAWTSPMTWVTGAVVTAAQLNTQLRDNLRDRRGLDGTVTFEDGLDLGTNELTVNSVEIVGVDGEVNKAAIEQLDHGTDLAGLGDDDHTQYALRTILTTRGDMVFRNASDWARLAKGTENFYLKQGTNDPFWSAGTENFFLASGNLTAGSQNAKIFSWRNTAVSGDILVMKVILNITTEASAAARIDVGQAATEVQSNNIMDSLSISGVPRIFDSILHATGAGLGLAAVADDEWVTGWEDNNAASTGLVGKFYIIYMEI